MNKRLLSLMIAGLLTGPANAIEVIPPPGPGQAELAVTTPDEKVRKLGKVDIHIDLSAAQDDVLDLKVRHSALTMPGGQPFHSFAAHKDGGLIVLGGNSVETVSITSVESSGASREALILFYGKGGEIIAPAREEIALYDLEFNPLPFDYEPLSPPGSSHVPVNILLDISGSMDGELDIVRAQTQAFMQALPDFTDCSVTLFNQDLHELRAVDGTRRLPCQEGANLLNVPITASGLTALFAALEHGMQDKPEDASGPLITIAVTDGMNTESFTGDLSASKQETGAKIFVFWAGNYAPGHLAGLADLEIVSTDDLDAQLERFFRSLGISISGLQSIQLH